MRNDASPRDDATANEPEQILAAYVDRLNAGEHLDLRSIAGGHPEVAAQLELILALRPNDRNDPNDPTPGACLGSLGDYTLVREIGRGGMGVVYEAWQNSMARPVALKVLPAGIAADAKAVARFVHEAQVAGKLQHPHVVSVFGMGVEGGVPYFAMELVEGDTLAQSLKRSPKHEVDAQECFTIAAAFAGVAEGLQHAHEQKVVHRDLKPSNLISDRQGRLRILDFGLARLEGEQSLTRSGDLVGTPLYMSPEQARAKKVPIDKRTDIYSLGATLYEVLTRRPPFRGKDHQDTLSQIITREPVPPRKLNDRIPKELETIVLKCLRKDAGDRYGTAEALAQDLRRLVRGDPIEARAQPRWERALRAIKREKWKVAGTLLAVLLLVTGGFLFQSRSREAEQRSEEVFKRKVLQALGKIELGQSRRESKISFDETVARDARREFTGTMFEQAWSDFLEKAVSDLNEAVTLRPQRAEGYYFRARALIALSREEEARGDLAKALRAEPDFDPARALLESIAPKTPTAPLRSESRSDRVDLWLAAEAASRESRWVDAIAAYAKLIDLEQENPRSPTVLLDLFLRRGKVRLDAGEHDGALEDFTVASNRWPDLLEPALLVAKTYLLKKRPEVAEARFTTLYAGAASRDDAASAIARVYRDMKEWEKALEWFCQISDEAQRERKRAGLLLNRRRWGEAAAAATRSLEIQPKNDEALYVRGSARTELGDLAGAIADFTEALRISPDAPGIHYSRGTARYQQGDFKGALADIDQAVRIHPKSADVYNTRGVLREELGDLAGARADLNEALRLRPHFAYAYYNRSALRDKTGDREGALADLQACVGFQPSNVDARLSLAITLAKRREFEGAIQELNEVMKLDPRNAKAYSQRGMAYARSGKVDEALADCEQLIQIESKDPLDLYNGACLLMLVSARISNSSSKEDGDASGQALRHVDRAVELVRLAIEKGFKDFRLMGSDPDLAPALFWRHPGLQALLEELVEKNRDQETQLGTLLECLAKSHAARNELRQAVRTLERASRLPGANASIGTRLEEYRRALLPDLPTYASIDAARAPREPLVPEGAEWRFFRGRVEPSAGTEWAGLSFDDHGWETGPSGFGYGDDDDKTLLEDMEGHYTTLYVRRTFETPEPERFAKLFLSVRADDGFVAYLNGREIGRERVEAGSAQNAPEPLTASEIYIRPEDLLPGTNVLAIQGINAALASSDFSLIPVLFGLPRVYDPTKDRELFDSFRAVATGDNAPLRLGYLEGRILEREGKLLEAAERFKGVAALERTRPEPHLRLAECLLAAQKTTEAEACLRAAIGLGMEGDGPLFDLWLEIAMTRLGWSIAQMVDALPRSEVRSGDAYTADRRWLLEQLNAGAVRINCGGGEYRSPSGAVWGRDRFFTGGQSYEATASPNPNGFRVERITGGYSYEATASPNSNGFQVERIVGTDDEPLYRTERSFDPSQPRPLGYRIPLPPGLYRVTLHLAEIFSPIAGNRIFGVDLEGESVLRDFEPVAAGFATAQVKRFEVRVLDGALDVVLVPQPGWPCIDGIEIEALRGK